MLKTEKTQKKKSYPMDSKTVERRKKTIERLEKQLKSGKKPLRNERGKTELKKKTELSELDIKRISKELEILKTRI
jgi:hypothetical protein